MAAYILFWLSLATLSYVWFGFMLILLVMSLLSRKKVRQTYYEPTVSIIVCAYNEAKSILHKIENCLALDYPHDKIEIIVVSDGSTDGTNDILNAYRHPLVRIIIMPQRAGKSACQNRAAQEARNDILFFTDATTMHPPEALRVLLKGFSDPTVGCVTGRPVFKRDNSMTSHGLGVREKYELYLRKKLSETQTLFGAQDCMYVIPRNIFVPTRPDLDSGFVGPLQLLEKGYRTVYAFDALAFIERRPPTLSDEFARRSRMILRGLRGLIHMRQLINPLRYGFTAVALVSSRLLRWLSPVLLLLLFLSNLFLLDAGIAYCVFFAAQILFYGAALAGYWYEKQGKSAGKLFSIPFYFCMLMCAACLALARLCTGATCQTWETRR